MSSLSLWPAPLRSHLEALELGAGDLVAFDADETLWDMDCGVGFLEWASDQGKLPSQDGESPFEVYSRARLEDEREGLVRCADAFSGQEVAEVAGWAEEFFTQFGEPKIYPAMRQLVEYVEQSRAQFFIVTASPDFTVIPGAKALGLGAERVVGIQLEAEGGVYGSEIFGPVTYRQGKPEALRSRTGQAPRVAAGNGNNDRELLEAATDLAFAVNPSRSLRRDQTPSLYDAAKERAWPILKLGLESAELEGESPRASC